MWKKHRPILLSLTGSIRRAGFSGLTLVEVVVGVAVFLLVALGLYAAFNAVNDLSRRARLKVAGTALANEQLEIVRNLPYADVGIVSGLPVGKIPREQTLVRGGATFRVTTTVRNIDDPFDGTIGGNPSDTSPADYRLVEVGVACAACRQFLPFSVTTVVAPRSLETSAGNGALFVRVFDANGQPVLGAEVHIENTQGSATILIDDTTNNDGLLQIVDAPPGVAAYEITVTKQGYSTERTYTPGDLLNPNPLLPHATVVAGQVTQVSFGIDRVSTLEVSSVTDVCAPVDGVAFSLQGAKLLGTDPNILKYAADHLTGLNGEKLLADLEWDEYSVNLTSATYDLLGAIPLLPLQLSPNSTQNLSLVVAPKDPLSILLAVKDAATQLPLSDATVTLTAAGFSSSRTTGQGSLRQTDWSGGAGQTDFVDATKFLTADGNIAVTSPAGELKLLPGRTNGELTSSTLDTGAPSTVRQLLWQPQDQPPETGADSVRFQVAANTDNATWDFSGPDGTAATYYTLSDPNLSATYAGKRYFRYKVFLQTADVASTPNLADVAITFTSACVPPGQALFTALQAGDYTVTVSKSGYQPYSDTVTVVSGWQQRDVLVTPQ